MGSVQLLPVKPRSQYRANRARMLSISWSRVAWAMSMVQQVGCVRCEGFVPPLGTGSARLVPLCASKAMPMQSVLDALERALRL